MATERRRKRSRKIKVKARKRPIVIGLNKPRRKRTKISRKGRSR
jgi:hypothetical protein